MIEKMLQQAAKTPTPLETLSAPSSDEPSTDAVKVSCFVRLADPDRVVQTCPTHGTTHADALGPAFASLLFVLALEMRGREEDGGLRPSTGGLCLPQILYSLDTHKDPPKASSSQATVPMARPTRVNFREHPP